MAIIFFILSWVYWSDGGRNAAIPKVMINDPSVLRVIDLYDREIKKEKWDESGTQQLILRVVEEDRKVIYIACTNLISTFNHNVPDSYANFNNRTVFIYTSNDVSGDEDFRTFYDQFEHLLGKDITRELTQSPDFDYGMIHHVETWRVELAGNSFKTKKVIPMFPDKTFYKEFLYNDDGQMVYKDGIYHVNAIDPHQWEPDNFDLRVYILQNTSVPEYKLGEEMVVAILVIDEKGKVTEAVIEGLNDEALEEEVIEALTRMPAWHPGRIDGRPVKVRFRQRL